MLSKDANQPQKADFSIIIGNRLVNSFAVDGVEGVIYMDELLNTLSHHLTKNLKVKTDMSPSKG